MYREIRLIEDAFPDEPGMDTALSRTILHEIDAGDAAETLRIHRPGRVMAFGRHDTISPGYAAAVQASRMQGFTPIERLAGGRAAVFHPGTIAFSWAMPEHSPKEGVTARFRLLTTIMVQALQSLGVDAQVGEVPGEYCPGSYSVHTRGARKLVGTGQRLTRRAAHVGGVIVVDGRDEVNSALGPVYRALDLDWDPAATGDIVSEVPGTEWRQVRDAVVSAFAARFTLERASIEGDTLERAREMAPHHIPE